MQAPSAVLEAWKMEFDMLYEEDREFVLAMHPQIIGRPSRIKALEGLIQHIQKHDDIWFGAGRSSKRFTTTPQERLYDQESWPND
ncbi:MAG: hypothetical protein Ct9H300mP27_04030 [Chloroflexota bacterium]|nr:MAG: hypothetical protein Ct9H300mP27_04030 [Chloroflexota bacterium]